MHPIIESLQYRNNGWDVRLPTVKAYNFSSRELDSFIIGSNAVPYIFDTNLVRSCNVNCKYCSTFGGRSDLRYNELTTLPLLDDDLLKKLVPALAKAGVKTVFLCSNGEPLIDINRFLGIANVANAHGLKIITYTNGSTLNEVSLRQLLKCNVNLVMKLESLDCKLNSEIIASKFGSFRKGTYDYTYSRFNGILIPTNIITAFEIYAGNENMLAIETMITKDNIGEVLDLRSWIYSNLKVAQFLKKVYNIGYVQIHGYDVRPLQQDEEAISANVQTLDHTYGFKYPKASLPDEYSFDVRRFLNNVTNRKGTALRMFSHERGGVYHSSQIVKRKFGFGTNNVVPIELGQQEGIDVIKYYNQIQSIINSDEQS